MLEPDFNVLRWDNYLKNPDIPTLVDIQAPPTTIQKLSGWGRWIALALALLFLFALLRLHKTGKGRAIPALAGLLMWVVLTGWLVHENRQSRMDEGRLQALVGDLLHNVYRAFDYRGEEVIYDVLARSAAGNLLTDVYLETRRGLELASQGGARVKVKDVEIIETSLKDSHGDTLVVESRWNVSGSVGHWGHIHQRRNGYHANLEISDVDGVWKLTGLDILQEERL